MTTEELQELATRLYEIFDGEDLEPLAKLALGETIRYRVNKDEKRGVWQNLATRDVDAWLEFFDVENEDGPGYSVAAVGMHLRDDGFRVREGKPMISYDASDQYFEVDFHFERRGKKLGLTSIDVWEVTPP